MPVKIHYMKCLRSFPADLGEPNVTAICIDLGHDMGDMYRKFAVRRLVITFVDNYLYKRSLA